MGGAFAAPGRSAGGTLRWGPRGGGAAVFSESLIWRGGGGAGGVGGVGLAAGASGAGEDAHDSGGARRDRDGGGAGGGALGACDRACAGGGWSRDGRGGRERGGGEGCPIEWSVDDHVGYITCEVGGRRGVVAAGGRADGVAVGKSRCWRWWPRVDLIGGVAGDDHGI